MGEDPTNKQFREDQARLMHNLLFDSEGSLKFKLELWSDIRCQLHSHPAHRVHQRHTRPRHREPHTRNLFPNVIALEAHNFIWFLPHAAIEDESQHCFTLTFRQMQADMRDMVFYYRKKTGMPKMHDSGLTDIVLGGEGLTATAVLFSAGNEGQRRAAWMACLPINYSSII
ncbi:hypothetical protein DXG01_006681 [Tephrocybe rancida]|nr:hypothetical protein DXG01_006681 [Tephrocybe rancida]